jgi:hypothetical protein
MAPAARAASTPPRRRTRAVTIAAPALGAGPQLSTASTVPVVGTDPRAITLAGLLAQHTNPETITSHMVAELLNTELPARTSRRLLGEARQPFKAA